MKEFKVKKKVTEAVEELGKTPPDKFETYEPEVDPIPEEVMPISFTRSAKDTERNRAKANKLISDRRKLALDSTYSKPEDRFRNMSDKEKKFNNGEKVSLDESLFLSEDATTGNDVVLDVHDFKPWSMAIKNFDEIKKSDKLDELNGLIQELYPDNIKKSTLNDLLSFDFRFLRDQLGMKNEDD